MVSGRALQIPSAEAHNNVGDVERCSSSTEPTVQLGKVMGSSKSQPEKRLLWGSRPGLD